MNRIVIFLLFMLASFSIAFSTTSDMEDVDTIVKIWKEIKVYVDTSEFGYWYTNDHHIDNIVVILRVNGITDKENYWIAVMGDSSGKPVHVLVQIKLNGNPYKHEFIIKNVNRKGGCESDPSGCA